MGRSLCGGIGACILLAALTLSPATAREPIKDNNWTIVPLGRSCSAINRPPEEFHASPYNALAVNASKARGLELQVYFWPGYVDAGPVDLHLATPRGQVRVSGEAFGGSAIIVPFATADELRSLLEESAMLAVALPSKTESLTFGIEPLRRLLTQLEACAG